MSLAGKRLRRTLGREAKRAELYEAKSFMTVCGGLHGSVKVERPVSFQTGYDHWVPEEGLAKGMELPISQCILVHEAYPSQC